MVDSNTSKPNSVAFKNVNRPMSLPAVSFAPFAGIEIDSYEQPKPLLIDPALDLESQRSQLEDVPWLVEHLFPDNMLPLPVELLSSQLMAGSKQSQWDHKLNTWKNLPDLYWYSAYAKAEQKLANFLNQIGMALREICSAFNAENVIPSRPRVWEGGRTSTPLSSSDTTEFRKPDMTLVDGELDSWSSVLASAEVQGEDGNFKRGVSHLTNAAYMVFTTQDERCFNIGVSFTAHEVRVYVFDRSGSVGSEAFDLRKNPTLFIRLLAGLTLTKRSAIGFDPSIIHEGDMRFVIVDGKKYELVERLFVSDVIRGRGTVCWRARLDGFDYVIKDTWADIAHIDKEPTIMRAVSGLEGVAQLIADEVVMLEDGKEDSTSHLRAIIDRETYVKKTWLDNLEVRVHRRIVSTPFGRELSHFSTQKELLSALIDSIKAHRRLVENGILHRDISIGNLIMYRPTQRPAPSGNQHLDASSSSSLSCRAQATPLRTGLLIDMDFAIYMHEIDNNSPGDHRTGTLPFMAIDLLRQNPRKHEPRHDLESFFYVLLWICWNYAGPNNAERQNFQLSKTPARAWINGASYTAIATNKSGFFMFEDNFEDSGLVYIAPYFRNLKPCLRQLRDIIYQKTTQHEDVIKILQATMDGLPDIESWSPSDDEEGYGLRKGSKRTHDATYSPVDEDNGLPRASPKKRPRSEPTRPPTRYSTNRRSKLRSIRECKPRLPTVLS